MIYRFDVITIKISVTFFPETEETIQTFTQRTKDLKSLKQPYFKKGKGEGQGRGVAMLEVSQNPIPNYTVEPQYTVVLT